MPKMLSLHESEDAKIVRIIESNHDWVKAEIRARIDAEQRTLFLDLNERVLFDARSSLARFGINVETDGNFVWENSHLVAQAVVRNFIPEYMPADVTLDRLFETGVHLGKYYVDDPVMHIPEPLLREYLSTRFVIVGEGRKLDDNGVLTLPLHKILLKPTANYSKDALRAIVSGRESRSRLTKYQEAQEVDRLVVPKKGGIVTMATLMTSGLEVIVLDKNHSGAKVGSQHTKFDFYAEYIGNGIEDFEIEGIKVFLARPRRREAKIYMPASLDSGPGVRLDDNPTLKKFSSNFWFSGDNVQFIEYFAFIDDSHGVYRRIARQNIGIDGFIEDFQNRNKISFIFNQFPGNIGRRVKGDVIDDLKRLSKEGRLKTLYLLNAPNGVFFSGGALEDLSKLAEQDTTIYWRNPNTNKWMIYYSGFWVKPEKLQEFVDYHKSGKLVAFYGSSKKISDEVAQIADDTLDGILRFHGVKVGFITGGWGEEDSFMQRVSQKAREKGLLVGGVFWNVQGQPHDVDMDFVQYYDERHLLPRQELMARVVEIEVYGPGGFGTHLEFYNTMTMKSRVGIGARKTILLLGDASTLKAQAEYLVKEGFASKESLNNIHAIDDGKRVYDILCGHFKTMR